MYDAPGDLSEELQERIREDRARGWVNPYRCSDDEAIRRHDEQRDRSTLWRPAFVRDVEKIMHLPAYNRYAGKTQVFSFRQNDDICRRGLHVQLVARVARDIGRALGLNCDLIEAIALGHDIGHAPFGHAGERMLDEVYFGHTGRHFRHNVHSVRVLDGIYGRNLTLQVLDGVLCHNGEYVSREFRTSGISSFAEFDESVRSCAEQGDEAIRRLRPMTLEGCVVRISDIIAYVGKDRQDALTAGSISDAAGFSTVSDGNLGAYNAWVLQHLTVDIVENSYGKDHIEMSQRAYDELVSAKRENYRLIYENPDVEGAFDERLEGLFGKMYDRILADVRAEDTSSPVFAHHIKPLEDEASHYGRVYDWKRNPDQTAVDYIASMTDDYFVALCEYLFSDDDLAFPRRGYFDGMPGARRAE
jgi:dGTPase